MGINYCFLENITSKMYLSNWFNVIGFMDEIIFWMKHVGFKFIDEFSWIAYEIRNAILFLIGKNILHCVF